LPPLLPVPTALAPGPVLVVSVLLQAAAPNVSASATPPHFAVERVNVPTMSQLPLVIRESADCASPGRASARRHNSFHEPVNAT
jgi:hypothetical protein